MAWTIAGERPAFCPSCGDSLEGRTVEGNERLNCTHCERTIYRNPILMARTTVIEGDSALLIEMGAGTDVGEWALASGHIETDESPRAAAARELEEETSMATAPGHLSLIGSGFLEFASGETMVSFNFAVSRAATDGEPKAYDDAADVRFFSVRSW